MAVITDRQRAVQRRFRAEDLRWAVPLTVAVPAGVGAVVLTAEAPHALATLAHRDAHAARPALELLAKQRRKSQSL